MDEEGRDVQERRGIVEKKRRGGEEGQTREEGGGWTMRGAEMGRRGGAA